MKLAISKAILINLDASVERSEQKGEKNPGLDAV